MEDNVCKLRRERSVPLILLSMYQILFYLYKQYQEIDRNKAVRMTQAVQRKKRADTSCSILELDSHFTLW